MSRLQTIQLSKHFGGIQALNGVSLSVAPGERHAIIGPNGAGKSTLFNVISGELEPTLGNVYLDGRDITNAPVYARANAGLGHTFQRCNLFTGLTAFENVRLAVQHQQRINGNWFRRIESFPHINETIDSLLEMVGLSSRRDTLVNTLAHGQQKGLEIALALAIKPKVLLLDEPTAGMSPAETVEMTQLIDALPRSLTLLIVEHDMDVIFGLADQLTVLHYGQVISRGTPAEVRADATVQEIYLGATVAHVDA